MCKMYVQNRTSARTSVEREKRTLKKKLSRLNIIAKYGSVQ